MKKRKTKIDIINKMNILEDFGYISHDVNNTAKDKILMALEEQAVLKEKLIDEIRHKHPNMELKIFLPI